MPEAPHLAPFLIPLLPRKISSNTGFLWNYITTTTFWRQNLLEWKYTGSEKTLEQLVFTELSITGYSKILTHLSVITLLDWLSF